MLQNKREDPKEKVSLHPRNKHRERYDFNLLITAYPELSKWVRLNPFGDESIDFFNPWAVKVLNIALLKHYYDIEYWDIPAGYLCPPIPGRADYIHYMADLLGSNNHGKIPSGNHINCLDIGVGANCVYPIIGNKEYGWSFTGADVDRVAIESAKQIIEGNRSLKDRVELRLQDNQRNIFVGIVQKEERFDLSICNPPFHSSASEAKSGALRKLKNLTGHKISNPALNFGGQNNELWCEGGESGFVQDMIRHSRLFPASCFWFSTLISKESNLKNIYGYLKEVGAVEVKTIPMGQGNKISRIVAWTFLTKNEQQEWVKEKWR
jgi:23S rRNA (adenine1618-N6)-methyltransferase